MTWASPASRAAAARPPLPSNPVEASPAVPSERGKRRAAATLAPGALLAALTEAAFAGAARLSDDELTGALEAARRLQNRACYLQTLATAELAHRRMAQHEEDKAAGVPRNRRRAQFPDLELAAQLLIGRRHAQHLLDEAAISELAVRLRNGGAEGTLRYWTPSRYEGPFRPHPRVPHESGFHARCA